MRTLKINQRKMYFAPYKDKEPIIDSDGHRTGEYEVKYGKVKAFRGNVNYGSVGMFATTGAKMEQFGITEEYDATIVLERREDIDDKCVLWVESDPKLDENGVPTQPHDFIVRRAYLSINGLKLGVKQVSVS